MENRFKNMDWQTKAAIGFLTGFLVSIFVIYPLLVQNTVLFARSIPSYQSITNIFLIVLIPFTPLLIYLFISLFYEKIRVFGAILYGWLIGIIIAGFIFMLLMFLQVHTELPGLIIIILISMLVIAFTFYGVFYHNCKKIATSTS